MKFLCLLFKQILIVTLLSNSEKVVSSGISHGAPDFLRKTLENVVDILNHRYLELLPLRVVQINPKVVMYLTLVVGKHEALIGLLILITQELCKFVNLCLVPVGYLSIINMPSHSHRGAINHLIGHARVVVVDNEPVSFEIISKLFVEP